MAEIRLICPGCAAEYRLSDAAIPPGGREVECSACGKVWHATAQPVPVAPAPGDEPPRLSRPLPDAVLDILRGEVEHERRARAAEDTAPLPPPASAAPPRAADPEWPATTITTAITPPVGAGPIRHAPPQAKAGTVPSQASPAPPVQEPAPPPAGAGTPLPDKPPVVPGQPAPVPTSGHGRAGYAAGFGLAAMLAAACVGLYLLAPRLSDHGTFGAGLMELRTQMDEARLWLQDRAIGPAR